MKIGKMIDSKALSIAFNPSYRHTGKPSSKLRKDKKITDHSAPLYPECVGVNVQQIGIEYEPIDCSLSYSELQYKEEDNNGNP